MTPRLSATPLAYSSSIFIAGIWKCSGPSISIFAAIVQSTSGVSKTPAAKELPRIGGMAYLLIYLATSVNEACQVLGISPQ